MSRHKGSIPASGGCAPMPAGSADVTDPSSLAIRAGDGQVGKIGMSASGISGERIEHAAGVSGVAGALRFPSVAEAAASVADSGKVLLHRHSAVEPAWKDDLRASEILSRAHVQWSGFRTLAFRFDSEADALRLLRLLGKEQPR